MRTESIHFHLVGECSYVSRGGYMLAHRNFTCIEGCQPHAIIKRTHWECRSLKRYRSHKRNRMLLQMANVKIIAVIYSLLYVCVCLEQEYVMITMSHLCTASCGVFTQTKISHSQSLHDVRCIYVFVAMSQRVGRREEGRVGERETRTVRREGRRKGGRDIKWEGKKERREGGGNCKVFCEPVS